MPNLGSESVLGAMPIHLHSRSHKMFKGEYMADSSDKHVLFSAPPPHKMIPHVP